ncbi:MAG: hypothetical protein PQJ50_17200 [Spirochaetales bacterium]|nr:hypothetical protein [Spirochaetales bacterium]
MKTEKIVILAILGIIITFIGIFLVNKAQKITETHESRYLLASKSNDKYSVVNESNEILFISKDQYIKQQFCSIASLTVLSLGIVMFFVACIIGTIKTFIDLLKRIIPIKRN